MDMPEHRLHPRISLLRPILFWNSIFLMLAIGVVALWVSSPSHTLATAPPKPVSGQLPLAFVPNQGQTDASVHFIVRGGGGTMFFRPDEAVLALPSASTVLSTTAIRLRYQQANATPEILSGTRLPGIVNYLIGNDPARWQTALPTYADITYKGLYAGVDLQYAGSDGQLKSTYRVAPGADTHAIRWRYLGATAVSVDEATGDLIISLPKANLERDTRTIVEHAPSAWQEINGQNISIPVRYAVASDATIGFTLGSYDVSQPLLIDPLLTYSTYLGGSGSDQGDAIAVDSAGNTYVTGFTASSSTFPTQSPLYTYQGNTDAFITKLNAAGNALIYSTYLGGSSSDKAHEIALDSSNAVVVTGETQSSNFPLINAYDTSYNGGTDAFVTKLNASGSALVYSTYLGGSGEDQGLGTAVDSSGNIFITGFAGSGFPTLNAYDSTQNGGADVFVAKLNPAASGSASLVYSTYLGGSSSDRGTSIALDTSGKAYITGFAASGLPMLNAYDSSYNGSSDAFLAKLNLSVTGAASLVYATYLGGAGEDKGLGIAVDTANNAYITGYTLSTAFPTLNPKQNSLGGDKDAFIAKINPTASGTASLLYSTYFGSTNEDQGLGIALGNSNQVYITGLTRSSAFPIAAASSLQATFGGGTCNAIPCSDAFVTQLDVGTNQLIYSTFLGGNNNDEGHGIALDAAHVAYSTGLTLSSNFPTANPRQGSLNGTYSDAFIAKIDGSLPLPTATPTATVPPVTETAAGYPAPVTATNTPLVTATKTPTPGAYPPPVTPTLPAQAPTTVAAYTNFVQLPIILNGVVLAPTTPPSPTPSPVGLVNAVGRYDYNAWGVLADITTANPQIRDGAYSWFRTGIQYNPLGSADNFYYEIGWWKDPTGIHVHVVSQSAIDRLDDNYAFTPAVGEKHQYQVLWEPSISAYRFRYDGARVVDFPVTNLAITNVFCGGEAQSAANAIGIASCRNNQYATTSTGGWTTYPSHVNQVAPGYFVFDYNTFEWQAGGNN